MATQTPNLNLVLPDYSDKADVGVINDNFKKIDNFSGGGKVEEWLGDIQEKADASLAKISQDANAHLQSLQTEAAESLREIENKAKNALDSIPDDYETIYNDVSTLKDTKADCIIDTSAKAASHTLHAQSGPMSVTLHGKTVETGTGEKSPENPYTISGVDKAEVQAGSKNLYGGLYMAEDIAAKVPSAVIDTTAKTVKYSATAISGVRIFDRFKPNTQYTIVLTSSELSNANRPNLAVYYTDTSSPSVLVFAENAGTKRQLVYHTIAGKSVKYLVGYNNSGNQYLLYEECGIFEGVLTADDFEAFNANVIDMPLLPDGDPLMDGDTVENDVLSGCDATVTLTGNELIDSYSYNLFGIYTHNLPLKTVPDNRYPPFASNAFAGVSVDAPVNTTAASNLTHKQICWRSGDTCDRLYIKYMGTVDELRALIAEKQPTIYYRSTAYTPEKDIRVTKVTRKMDLVTFDGTEAWAEGMGSGYSFYYTNVKKAAVAQHRPVSSHTTPTNVVFVNGTQLRAYMSMYGTLTDWTDFLKAQAAAGTPFTVLELLATPEIYMTDHHDLRKPYGIMPVTVTGSGETAVEYPHDTKHYIDSQIAAAVALALGN